jgi:hypothetical protein
MICPHCNSYHVKKDGRRLNREPIQQRFKCGNCKKGFSIPISSLIPESPSIDPGGIFEYKSDKVVRVHGLTDVHVGAGSEGKEIFDRKKFQEAIKAIYEDDNAVWFGNGDMIECIPPHYKISQRGQYIPPDSQHEEFINLVRPIADKCLFMRGGNHDFLRSINLLDYDVAKMIAKDLAVPYFQYPGYSVIKVNGKEWNLVTGHGKSGAKNGDLELYQMSNVYSKGDVFFLGHNHQLYAKPLDSLRVEDNKEKLYKRWFIRGGSFLNYADYARYSFYQIVRTGWVTMEFTSKDISCWVN